VDQHGTILGSLVNMMINFSIPLKSGKFLDSCTYAYTHVTGLSCMYKAETDSETYSSQIRAASFVFLKSVKV
jgi:hypothetical protein